MTLYQQVFPILPAIDTHIRDFAISKCKLKVMQKLLKCQLWQSLNPGRSEVEKVIEIQKMLVGIYLATVLWLSDLKGRQGWWSLNSDYVLCCIFSFLCTSLDGPKVSANANLFLCLQRLRLVSLFSARSWLFTSRPYTEHALSMKVWEDTCSLYTKRPLLQPFLITSF